LKSNFALDSIPAVGICCGGGTASPQSPATERILYINKTLIEFSKINSTPYNIASTFILTQIVIN
jgi:hypothetical protein